MLDRNEDKRYAVKFACLDNLVPKGRKIEKAVGQHHTIHCSATGEF